MTKENIRELLRWFNGEKKIQNSNRLFELTKTLLFTKRQTAKINVSRLEPAVIKRFHHTCSATCHIGCPSIPKGFWCGLLVSLHSLSECDTQLGAEDRSCSATNGWEGIQLGALISISADVCGGCDPPPCPNCRKTVQVKASLTSFWITGANAVFHSTQKVRISNFLLGKVQQKVRLPIWKTVRKSRGANIT